MRWTRRLLSLKRRHDAAIALGRLIVAEALAEITRTDILVGVGIWI